MTQHPVRDSRQRFYLHNLPIRGEVVHLHDTLQTILAQRSYPVAVQQLLGEMLSAAALLASTLKIEGRLSIQIQGSGALRWAMAECNHLGELRALAELDEQQPLLAEHSNAVLKSLVNGVLFISIEPAHGERYQGIVAMDRPTLAECLVEYYNLSAQIPTRLVLASTAQDAGGLLVQLLPRTEQEKDAFDDDAWDRVRILAETLKPEELTDLESRDILYRLYHQEQVRLPEAEPLTFGCTCSQARCAEALLQVGEDAVKDMLLEHNPIEMHCQFCNSRYCFNAEDALGLFGHHVS